MISQTLVQVFTGMGRFVAHPWTMGLTWFHLFNFGWLSDRFNRTFGAAVNELLDIKIATAVHC